MRPACCSPALQRWQGILTEKIETTGVPAAVQLAPNHAVLKADGEDVAIISVSVLDAQAASCRTR